MRIYGFGGENYLFLNLAFLGSDLSGSSSSRCTCKHEYRCAQCVGIRVGLQTALKCWWWWERKLSLSLSGSRPSRYDSSVTAVTGIFWVRFFVLTWNTRGTAVAQWLRCCATIRTDAGSIPAGVSGFFIDIKSFRSHNGSGVDSASNRNEHQEYFLGVKAASA